MATTKALELAQFAGLDNGIEVNANGEITNIGTMSSLDVSGDISTSTLTASANVAIDTDTLFVDTVNDRVGINVTPQRAFHVEGATRPALIGSTNASHVTKLYNSATGSATYEGMDLGVNSTSEGSITTYGMPFTIETSANTSTGGITRFSVESNGDIQFYEDNSGTPQVGMHWDYLNGNLGIATTNPNSNYPLHVNGIVYAATGIQMDSGYKLNFGNPNQYIRGTNDTSIEIVTGGSTSLTVLDNGNVSMAGDLTVSGDFTVSGNTTFINSDNLEIEDLNITLASGAANSAVADGAGITIDGANAQLTYSGSSDAWVFNKKVGIGTVANTHRLTIEEDTGGAVNLLQLRNPTNLYNQNWSYSLDTNKDLVITGASSVGGVVYQTGSRGFNIGSTVTGHKLNVSTNTAGDTDLVRLYAGGTATGGSGADLKIWASSSQINITSGTNDNIQFQVDDGDALKDILVLAQDGNVGVGLTGPQTTLHIKGPNTSGRGQVTIEGNGDNVDPRLSFYGFNTTSAFANTSSYGLDIFVDTSDLAARYDVPTGMEQWWTIQGSPKIKLDQYGDLKAINDNYDYHIHKKIDGWDGDASADNFLLICEVGALNVRINGRITAARSGSASAVFGSTHNLGFVTNNTGAVLGNYCESSSTYESGYGASFGRLVSLTYNGTNYYAFQFNGAGQDWIVDFDACHFDGHATSDVLFDVISTDQVTVSNVSLVDTEGGRKIFMDQTIGIGTPVVADGSKLNISSNGGNSVYQTFTRSTGGSNSKHWRIGIDAQHEFKIERQNDNFTQGTEYFYTGPNNTRINGDPSSQSSVLKVTRQQAAASNNTYTFEVDSSVHTSNMSSGGAMAVDVNGGRALTIDGFGRVGLGTSTPNEQFHVSSGSTLNGGLVVETIGDATNGDSVGLAFSENNIGATTISGVVMGFNGGSSTGVNLFNQEWPIVNNHFAIYAVESTTTKNLAISIPRNNGYVGIGKDTPQAQLHVLGDTRFETPSTSGGYKHYFSNTGTGGQDYWLMSTSNSNGSLLGGKFAIGTDSVSGNNAAQTRFVIDSNGSVGIGTTAPNHKLEVNGSFAATSKSFDIEHPTKEGMRLHHGSLEGPEHGVYVRGRLTDSNVIVLPDYWTGLVDEDTITVQLTAIGGKQNLWVEDIVDNSIIVGFEDKVNCFYFVQAERKDIDKFDVEYVDGK